MIISERAIEKRIKRANTDWWINEKSVVGKNGKTYIAYFTDMGEIHVKEIDAKCSRSLSRDVCLAWLNGSYADEHNAPSICITDSGRIVVAYTAHAATDALTIRISERPYDIESFGKEKVLTYHGTVTYAQLFENTRRRELWLFTRVNRVTWTFRRSSDMGSSWSEPHIFLHSDAGGLFYFNARKQLLWDAVKGPCEQWFFALYGHPLISGDHVIRAGIFDDDGNLLRMDGSGTGKSLLNDNERGILELEKLETVYAPPAGETVRLLEVSPTLPYRVGLAAFVPDRPDTIVYYMASWRENAFHLSQPICKGGEFLSPESQKDGSQTYVGGMACYYGVGEAGFHTPTHGETIDTNRVFIARLNGSNRVLESYVTHDCGERYTLEQVIRQQSSSDGRKIWRPVVPIHAQDNMPVYWHEGIYSAHTGGWHCDVVMLIEYDD